MVFVHKQSVRKRSGCQQGKGGAYIAGVDVTDGIAGRDGVPLQPHAVRQKKELEVTSKKWRGVAYLVDIVVTVANSVDYRDLKE